MKKILFVLFFGLLVACSAERLAIKNNKKEIYNNLDANEDTAFGDTIIDFDSSYTTFTLIEHQYQNIIKLKMNIQIFCVIM